MTLAFKFFQIVGEMSQLVRQIWSEVRRKPLYLQLIVEQVLQIGIKSFPLIMIVVGCVGMVMALQFGVSLEKFGGKMYVPKIVSLSIIRELGPVLAGLMMAARVGAGITSEIGSMKVTEQIDAIRALGTSPIKKIIIPRVVGSLIALPILSVMANTVGVYGGLFIGYADLGLDPQFYFQKMISTITVSDYLSGLGKSFFFAFFISVPACYYGLKVTGGTRGVGKATTRSVVTACILIIMSDYFLTKLFLTLEHWISG
ncbi:MAG: ABC transporter permease [Bdellovibrionales bacterium]|nr:ABC transporter permease [Bdellovibrionales bacterium]